jgi:hypothetical protein
LLQRAIQYLAEPPPSVGAFQRLKEESEKISDEVIQKMMEGF